MKKAVELSKQDKESARAIIEKLAEVTEMHGVDTDVLTELLDEKDLKERGGAFMINGR